MRFHLRIDLSTLQTLFDFLTGPHLQINLLGMPAVLENKLIWERKKQIKMRGLTMTKQEERNIEKLQQQCVSDFWLLLLVLLAQSLSPATFWVHADCDVGRFTRGRVSAAGP